MTAPSQIYATRGRRRGYLKGASLRGELIACGICGKTWQGGRSRQSCPSCGSFLSQLILSPAAGES